MPAQYPNNTAFKEARAASGGGFESAIEVVSGTPTISSVTDNGDGTLTIAGSGFGTKSQPNEILYDGGDFVRENGVENTYRAGLADGATVQTSDVTADEPWKGGTGGSIKLVKSGLRGAGATAKYAPISTNIADGAIWLGFPKAEVPAGDIPYHLKHHTRWWMKWKYSFSKLKTLRNWTVTSGSFVYPDLAADPNALGEELTMGDTGITGHLIRTDTNFKGTSESVTSIYTPNSTDEFEVPDGTTITGVTSGATATISSATAGTDDYGPEKVFRAYSQQSGSGSRFTIQQYDMGFSGADAKFSNTLWLTNKDITVDFEDTWVALDEVIDLEVNTASFFINGRLVAEMSGMNEDQEFGMVTAAIGWQAVRSIYNSIEFADIYVDHDLKCVYLGNAEVWENCTVTEIQPISWTGDTSVQVPALRTGALDLQSPVYAFLTTKGVPDPQDTGTITPVGGGV